MVQLGLSDIIPFDQPCGWNIIGTTPILACDYRKENPFLLQAGQCKTGDVIRFRAVSVEEAHRAWREANRELEELRARLAQPRPAQPVGTAYKVTVNGRTYEVQVVKHS